MSRDCCCTAACQPRPCDTGQGWNTRDEWTLGTSYAVDDLVPINTFGGGASAAPTATNWYVCIQAHTSTALDKPGAVNGATYWTSAPNNACTIVARAQNIQLPSCLIPGIWYGRQFDCNDSTSPIELHYVRYTDFLHDGTDITDVFTTDLSSNPEIYSSYFPEYFAFGLNRATGCFAAGDPNIGTQIFRGFGSLVPRVSPCECGDPWDFPHEQRVTGDDTALDFPSTVGTDINFLRLWTSPPVDNTWIQNQDTLFTFGRMPLDFTFFWISPTRVGFSIHSVYTELVIPFRLTDGSGSLVAGPARRGDTPVWNTFIRATLFYGEADVPAGWIDDNGDTTSAVTISNELTCSDMAGESLYDLSTGAPLANIGGDRSWVGIGAGGTVTLGATVPGGVDLADRTTISSAFSSTTCSVSPTPPSDDTGGTCNDFGWVDPPIDCTENDVGGGLPPPPPPPPPPTPTWWYLLKDCETDAGIGRYTNLYPVGTVLRIRPYNGSVRKCIYVSGERIWRNIPPGVPLLPGEVQGTFANCAECEESVLIYQLADCDGVLANKYSDDDLSAYVDKVVKISGDTDTCWQVSRVTDTGQATETITVTESHDSCAECFGGCNTLGVCGDCCFSDTSAIAYAITVSTVAVGSCPPTTISGTAEWSRRVTASGGFEEWTHDGSGFGARIRYRCNTDQWDIGFYWNEPTSFQCATTEPVIISGDCQGASGSFSDINTLESNDAISGSATLAVIRNGCCRNTTSGLCQEGTATASGACA